MKASLHPGEETLLAYASGTLAPGAALVVETHLAGCVRCHGSMRLLEALGGLFLGAAEPEPMAAGALGRALARLDVARPEPAPEPDDRRPLRGRKVGRWRWAGPQIRIAKISGAGGLDERIYLLRVAPGGRVPRHGHSGTEYVAVLEGAFRDGDQIRRAGDYVEHDETLVHALTASDEGECLCLIATEGRLRFSGAARWLQAWLGI